MRLGAILSLALTMPSALWGNPKIPSGLRTALLIGNGDYRGHPIPSVKKSLNLVEEALSKEGFAVVRHEDLEKKDDLQKVVENFVRSIPTNGTSLIYYLGLGAHVDRNGWQNLLRPTDEEIKNDGDYRKVGLNVEDHLVKPLTESSGSRVSLIFLDACWQSPLKPESQKVLSGLHALEVPENLLVFLPTGSGDTLPFPKNSEPTALTKALSRHIGQFNQSLSQGCQSVTKDLGEAWSSPVPETGLGIPPSGGLARHPGHGEEAGTIFVNSLGMVFRWCPAGRFEMGSLKTDHASTRDRKTVEVRLSQGFWMGEYEVTQREYQTVQRRDPPPGFTRHPNAPYYGIFESKSVTDFCKKLTEMERKAGSLPDGWEYLCPTEAEWEYACRAGSQTAYCFGDEVDRLGAFGNFADKSLLAENPDFHWADPRSDDGTGEALALVGSYLPNAWGLRDMHGNVAEIVADNHLSDLPGGTDPVAKAEKNGRPVMRGGAWLSTPAYCESSFRNSPPSRHKSNYIGFRIALKKLP